MSATIIPIRPPVTRVCAECENGFTNPNGVVFCEVFGTRIHNELVANTCEMFENPLMHEGI